MPTIKTISDEEIVKLLNWIWSPANITSQFLYPRRNHLLIVLMLDAGLRVSEVVQLKHRNLVMDGKPVDTIHIEAATTKTQHERNIPTTERIRNSIDAHLITIPKIGCQWRHRFAFPRPHSTNHIATRQVRRIITGAGKAALGRNISPHTLRHTFATRLLRYTSTRIVQQLLGHKCLSSTQIYTHPNSEDLKNAINQL